MKDYSINHTMQNYDFVEGTEFNSLMDAVMNSGVKTIGNSDVNVHMFGINALGADSLEVVDALAFYDEEPVVNGNDSFGDGFWDWGEEGSKKY